MLSGKVDSSGHPGYHDVALMQCRYSVYVESELDS